MPSNYKVKISDTSTQDLDERYLLAGSGANKGAITAITRSGFNGIGMIMDGNLYTTSGHWGSQANATTGRGGNGYSNWWGAEHFQPVHFPNESVGTVVKIGGQTYTFGYALMQNGNLYTWGNNNVGQTGLGHTSPVHTPYRVTSNVVDVFSSGWDGMWDVNYGRLWIKKSDNKIYVTGHNGEGNFGNGTTTSTSSFIEITQLGTDVRKLWNLGNNGGVTFAQKTNGQIWVTGMNNSAQMGFGDYTQRNTWTRAAQWEDGTVMHLTGNCIYNSATVLMWVRNATRDRVYTCGYNGYGSIGQGNTTARTTPYMVFDRPAGTIKDIACISHLGSMQMLTTDGTLYAWGYNGLGQLGNGTTTHVTSPFVSLTGVAALWSDAMCSNSSAECTQSFVTKNDGSLWSCGYNNDGQTGTSPPARNVTAYERVGLPNNERVKLLGHFTTNGAGRIHVLITELNNIYTWGYNGNSAISYGSYANTWVPAAVHQPARLAV